MSTLLDFARNYVERGWQPIPIPHGKKGPVLQQWQNLRLKPEELASRFNGTPGNIGILVGEPSGWLVDIDLDCQDAITLAPGILPPTMRFGRESKPASHWLYVAEGAQAKAFAIPSQSEGDPDRTIVEIRSTRQQTMFPPSTHPSGERVRFEPEIKTPAKIDAAELRRLVAQLAIASVLRIYDADRSVCDAVDIDHLEPLEASLPPETYEAVRAWFEPPKVRSATPHSNSDIDAAVAKYNADHAKDWPKNGGECPMCGHKDCFGQLADQPSRWCCFSASHKSPGIEGEHCYHGDALDQDAHAAGQDRVSLLRRDGYLAPARVASPTVAAGEPDEPKVKPMIRYDVGDGHLAIQAAIPVLGDCGDVYQRAQKLVHVVAYAPSEGETITRQIGAPIIVPLSSAHLWEVLSREVAWVKYDGRSKEDKACNPPEPIVSGLHSRGEWRGIKLVRGLITIPILRPNGTLSTTPGYDSETGLYYAPVGEPPEVRDQPTQMDAVYACNDLLDVVRDFPFVDDAARSAWLATVLARVGWGAFEGGAPLTVIDATTPGTGKTLLADVSALISTGSTAAHSPYVDDDDELRKRITSHLMAGDQVVLIDNVPGGARVGWPCLDNALTSAEWQDRELGTNNVARVSMDSLWMATGNNIEIAADAVRRTIRIRLETAEEHPEERSDFAHPRLVAWVREERRRLLASALTVLRAYICAGRPGMSLTPFGSFEGWSDLVRSAIVWAGKEDPCGARAKADDGSDQDAAAHMTLLADWRLLADAGGNGLTCKQVLGQVAADREVFGDMAEALATLCQATGTDTPTPKACGHALRRLKGRVRSVDGKRLMLRSKTGHKNTLLWWVGEIKASKPSKPSTLGEEDLKSGGNGGSGGNATPYAREMAVSDTLSSQGETNPPKPTNPPDENGADYDPDAWTDDAPDDDEVPF